MNYVNKQPILGINFIQVNRSVIFLIGLLISGISHSQNNQSILQRLDTIRKDSLEIDPIFRRVKISLNYSSATTFLGRKDTISIPILSPSFKYTTSKNFIYQISLVHTNTTNKLFDELDVKIGKHFYIGEKYDASLSYSHFFFNKSVSRINSFVNNDINFYNGFDFNYFYSAINTDFTYGKKTFTIKGKKKNKTHNLTVVSRDISLTWINLRQFYFYEFFNQNDKFIVTPEIDLVFGTQNSIRLYKNINTKQTAASRFQIRAITLNLDLLYVYKQLSFNISPFVTFPKNVVEGQASKPYFVIYAGLFYAWKWEKK